MSRCKCCGGKLTSPWTCEGCYARWCGYCNSLGRVTTFMYGRKDLCSYCFPRTNKYECTKCPKGSCCSIKCHRISFDYEKDGDSTIYRGLCCRQQKWKNVCVMCKVWESKRICTLMIGIRKFRTDNVLRAVPRDVLIHAMLKPHVFKLSDKEVQEKNKKMKI